MFDQFDIVIVPFPFSDDFSKSKYRPAVVISSSKYNKTTGCSICLMITSANHSTMEYDYEIQNYSNTNLTDGCIIRAKMFTLDNLIVKGKIGILNDIDAHAIKNSILKNIFLD